MNDNNSEKPIGHRLKLRNTELSDYPDIQEIMDLVYPTLEGAWTKSSSVPN